MPWAKQGLSPELGSPEESILGIYVAVLQGSNVSPLRVYYG
jgi:hypothetical protein